jgi:hypothetical protein
MNAQQEAAGSQSAIARGNGHVQIVVSEGRVTLEELHKALDEAIRFVVPKGGCNCGLTGFDLSFLRGDPALGRELSNIPNIQAGLIVHG